jgi:hypothetical protein
VADFFSDLGSAFVPKKPVPVKPEEPKPIPSAYRSTATHFKPIVLHRTESPVEKKEAKKESNPTTDCQPSEKDKEVVKKLKELKKNLMKHRQSVGGKDSEGEIRTPPRSPKHSKSSLLHCLCGAHFELSQYFWLSYLQFFLKDF